MHSYQHPTVGWIHMVNESACLVGLHEYRAYRTLYIKYIGGEKGYKTSEALGNIGRIADDDGNLLLAQAYEDPQICYYSLSRDGNRRGRSVILEYQPLSLLLYTDTQMLNFTQDGIELLKFPNDTGGHIMEKVFQFAPRCNDDHCFDSHCTRTIQRVGDKFLIPHCSQTFYLWSPKNGTQKVIKLSDDYYSVLLFPGFCAHVVLNNNKRKNVFFYFFDDQGNLFKKVPIPDQTPASGAHECADYHILPQHVQDDVFITRNPYGFSRFNRSTEQLEQIGSKKDWLIWWPYTSFSPEASARGDTVVLDNKLQGTLVFLRK